MYADGVEWTLTKWSDSIAHIYRTSRKVVHSVAGCWVSVTCMNWRIDLRSLPQDQLLEYGRDVHILKGLVNAEQKVWYDIYLSSNTHVYLQKLVENKLVELDRLPRSLRSTTTSTSSHQQHVDIDGAKAKNRSVYSSDLRRELFGDDGNEDSFCFIYMFANSLDKQSIDDATMDEDVTALISRHDRIQTELTEDVLQLTRNLKENITIAGHVIKEDNSVTRWRSIDDILFCRHYDDCIIVPIRIRKNCRTRWIDSIIMRIVHGSIVVC